jgi:dGTP triphosphohydrolase
VGNQIGQGEPGERLLEGLEGFLETRLRRSFDADRIRARGRRTVLGLFAAYHADPTLLEPYVLLRYKDLTGVRYLRDLPRSRVDEEVEARYRSDGRFVRLLADYISGMTDSYAIREHARLTEIGAIPIPSAEQLRRER